MADSNRPPVAGVILAGGLARRMGGGDKPLVAVAGRPMLAHAVARLSPQVAALALNANGDPDRFAAFGLPIIADTVPGFAGPLAGILAGLAWARAAVPGARFLASAAGDTPFFPADLVARLSAAGAGDERTVALAASPDGVHPVFGLWPIALADDLEDFLAGGESGKILAFVDRHRRVDVRFEAIRAGTQEIDPFFNVNTAAEREQAERFAALLAARPAA